MRPDLLGMHTGLGDDVYPARPGANHQDNLPGICFRFSEIDRVDKLATLPVPQPLICSIVGCPQRDLGVAVLPIRHDQVIERPRNPRVMTCRGVIGWDDLRPSLAS